MLAGRVQLFAPARAWLEDLPQGIVNFRRLEFAVSDDWGLFLQVQPVDQNNMVGIFNCLRVLPAHSDMGHVALAGSNMSFISFMRGLSAS